MPVQKKTYRISLSLLSTIVVTAASAIITHYGIRNSQESIFHPYILFAFITCVSLLALIVTIIKQKRNTTSFLRLNDANKTLERKVKELTRDLRDKNNAEKQLHEELRQIMAEKNTFLNTVAHDLKSPLNGILGLVNLIKFDYKALSAEQKEYIKYIDHSVVSMQNMIINLLDINRIKKDRNIINPEKMELYGLLHRHIKVYKERADQKNITLILEDNVPSVALIMDASTLARILENLISNAIKFSPRNTEVLIRIVHNNTHIKLEVIDQGPGIKKEEIPSLFSKDQRLSAPPAGKENSTGSGLAIVKELVTSLQGKISVESEENKGAKFTVELPLKFSLN